MRAWFSADVWLNTAAGEMNDRTPEHRENVFRGLIDDLIFNQPERRCSLFALDERPELNGEIGLAMRFAEGAGRWLVMLRNGEGKTLKPA